MVKRYLQKYTGILRNFKLVYYIQNLLSIDKLKRNQDLYEKYGIKKSIFSAIGKKDFVNPSDDIPWIDQENALELLETKKGFDQFPKQIQDQFRQFISEGFMILKSFYSDEDIQKHNDIIQDLKESGKIDYNYTGKKMNQVHEHSDFIQSHFFKNKELLRIFRFLMGKEIIPFHTIHFLEGSEQLAHSDSIHMSTEPEGYLIAAWTALEPTDNYNGPLFYYPGSHRLPYVSCLDYESGNTKWTIGGRYKKYEEKIAEILESQSFEKKYFYAESGDVLIWHANLIHGGDPIKEDRRTRKSMVGHYFCEDVICYHEITQRPAIIN